jgi:hypothetical protein
MTRLLRVFFTLGPGPVYLIGLARPQ